MMLKLWSVCLLCLRTPGSALRAKESARPSGGFTPGQVEALLEEALSKVTASSADWDAVYLRSLLHLNKYGATASQASMVNLLQVERREKLDWPRIIHQTAKDPDHLDGVFNASRASWTSTFPSWKYYLWSDAEIDTFMHTHYPFFMPTWENYPRQIMRIDAVRYFWLHYYGGIYADMDLFALKDFSSLLAEHNDSEVLLGRLGNGIDPQFHTNNSMEIALMISKPGARLWDQMISLLPQTLHFYCFLHNSKSGLFKESTKQLMTHPGVVQLEESIRHQLDTFQKEHGFQLNPMCNDTLPGVMTGPTWFTGKVSPDKAKLHEQGVTVVEPGLFYPVDWSTDEGQATAARLRVIASKNPAGIVPALQREFPNALTGTLWAHSWVGDWAPP